MDEGACWSTSIYEYSYYYASPCRPRVLCFLHMVAQRPAGAQPCYHVRMIPAHLEFKLTQS